MARSKVADLTWDVAIQRVLGEASGSLHYVEIANQIVGQGLKTKVGETPAASVAATLSNSIRSGDPHIKKLRRVNTP